MRQIFMLLFSIYSLSGTSQQVQLDIGTTLGSGNLEYRVDQFYKSVKEYGVVENNKSSLSTLDFYLAMVSKMSDKWYFRTKLETINFNDELDISYLRGSEDTLSYVGNLKRYQIALDLLAEYRIIDKDKWNIYANGGFSLIKRLPTSTWGFGSSSVKTTTLINLGANYWIRPQVGLHLSTGYRVPSYLETIRTFPDVAIKKYFVSIGLSLKRTNKAK